MRRFPRTLAWPSNTSCRKARRIDFVITGEDASARTKVMIIELKQLSESRRSDKDAIVWARRGRRAGEREGTQPAPSG